jgi:primosomal protein N' (replication factor Y) (superfamily II helicase)
MALEDNPSPVERNQSLMSEIASVVVENGPVAPLDYAIPKEMVPIRPGSLVIVTLRGKRRKGVVVELRQESPHRNLLPLIEVEPADKEMSQELWALACWISDYYMAPLPAVLRSMQPPTVRKGSAEPVQLKVRCGKGKEEIHQHCLELLGKAPAQAKVLEVLLQNFPGLLLTELLEKAGVSRSVVRSLAEKGILQLEKIAVDRSPLRDQEYFPTLPKPLNPDQQTALDQILSTQGFGVHLLLGVTGSGKTEVYLQAIAHMLQREKGALMLVPEIALTTQMVERFRSRFQSRVALLHHRLRDGERLAEWQRIRKGAASVVIGARSAIFSPLPNLGLIIVDEEHESSYKQTDALPRYQARDVAVMRGKFCQVPVVLGSATPSLESYWNAQKGKYRLSCLPGRVDRCRMPSVRIVDMKEEYEKAKRFTLLSDPLVAGLKSRYAQGEQALLFLNRRGYAAMQWCCRCQQALQCKNCTLSLTFHRGPNILACHLCGYTISPPPKVCPTCQQPDSVKFRGAGTEQVERLLHALLPELRVLRVDADTTRHQGSLEEKMRHFRTGRADVLLGTQMIAKGLHFPAVTLVGVLNSDLSLSIPDFRSCEQVFQLLTQVAGRAGRGERAGEVIIQTSMPSHPIIALAAAQDFAQFYAREIQGRERFGFPPCSHLIKLTLDAAEPTAAERAAADLAHRLSRHLQPPHRALPAAEAGHAKIKGRYRFQVLLQGPSVYHMNQQISAVLTAHPLPKEVRLAIDVDPASTFF